MLDRIIAIARKEWIQILRDPRTLAVVIALPIVMLGLYGYAFKLEVEHLPVAVYDLDRGKAARDLIAQMSASEYLDVRGFVHDPVGVARALDGGFAKAVVVFPRSFSQNLKSGRRAELQTIVDGSDANTAMLAIGYVNQIVARYAETILVQAINRQAPALSVAGPVEAHYRAWYNQDLKSSHFIIPGLIAVVLMMLSGLLTAMTVVRERERGTMEQLIVSPVTSRELIVGKLIPYVGIAMADVALGVALGQLLFDVPLRGSPFSLFLSSLIFLTAALGIGLLISVVATSQQAAMSIAWMITMLPSVLLSGFLYPIASMPKFVQAITYFVPARYYVELLRAIFLKGVGPAALWQPLLALLVFSVAVLFLSVVRFQKSL